ncbi:MAG: PAS domain S-box protein [Planctomycetota bacterium]
MDEVKPERNGSDGGGVGALKTELAMHLDNSPLAAIRWDSGFRLVQWSPQAERMFGWRAEELLGKGFGEWRFVYGEDLEAVNEIAERLLSGAETRNVYENRNFTKDGRVLECQWHNSVLLDEDGKLSSVFSLVQDVTPEREAEREVRRLNAELEERVRVRTAELGVVQSAVDQVRESVLITDADLVPPGPRIEYVNSYFCEVTGYTPGEVLGDSPRVLQGEQTDRAVLDELKSCLMENRKFSGETVNYKKDGTPYIVEWTVTPVMGDNGEAEHYVSIQRDLTEKRRAERELNRHREQLAHIARVNMMGEMATALAHEVNQPLTAITNYLGVVTDQLRGDGVPQEEMVRVLDRVQREAIRAGSVIRQLRRFVKKGELEPVPVDLGALVRGAIGLVGLEAKERGVGLDLSVEPDLPAVMGDAVQIEQVVLNVVRNAIEAVADLDEARRLVRLSVRAETGSTTGGGVPGTGRQTVVPTSGEDDPGRRAAQAALGSAGAGVWVEDEGPGLDDKAKRWVFEPYATTREEGMGMGLPISYSIAESYGGRLWAEDRRDGKPGAVFRLWLPAYKG